MQAFPDFVLLGDSPTRELADQVSKEIRRLATFIPNMKLLTLCGGVPSGPQTLPVISFASATFQSSYPHNFTSLNFSISEISNAIWEKLVGVQSKL